MKIAIIPGDGVGPELVKELTKIIAVINSHFKTQLEYDIFPFGATHFIKHSEILSADFIKKIQTDYQGIFIAALGDPTAYTQKYVLDIHKTIFDTLDLPICLKPIFLYSSSLSKLRGFQKEDFQIYFFRDSLDGLLSSGGFSARAGTQHEIASDLSSYSYDSIADILNYVFDFAIERNLDAVTLVVRNKLYPNIHKLWERVFNEIGAEKDIRLIILEMPKFIHEFLANPRHFSCVVSPGISGELLSEMLTELAGGIYLATSMVFNSNGKFLIEPKHGPINPIAGKGRVSPFAALLSLALIYQKLNMKIPAKIILHSIYKSFENKWLPMDLGGSLSTETIGDFIASYIDDQLSAQSE